MPNRLIRRLFMPWLDPEREREVAEHSESIVREAAEARSAAAEARDAAKEIRLAYIQAGQRLDRRRVPR